MWFYGTRKQNILTYFLKKIVNVCDYLFIEKIYIHFSHAKQMPKAADTHHTKVYNM